jgi:Xaa-Pro aminopeptidase
MRKCRIPQDVLKARRLELAKHTENSAVILPAHPEFIRNRDVHHPYRQDSTLYYFTGFEEPESVMVLRPGMEPEYTLFVRKKDPLKETWDGFRFGPEGAKSEFGADDAFLIDEFEDKMGELLKDVDRIYYKLNDNLDFDKRMITVFDKLRSARGRAWVGLPEIVDPSAMIGEMRLIKKPDEIETLRKACRVTAQAHLAAMKFTKPGVNERQIQGVLNYMMMMEGSAREGYGAIVATGNNATTLHYTFNDQECKDGDLLLIDAGAEFEYYTGDITRTFPVNGKFTEPQKRFYQAVLEAQNKVIDMCRPGTPFAKLQETTIRLLTEAMVDLGLLKGSVDELVESQAGKKYYPHGVSHWLGMDVHDVGSVMARGETRKLVPGMCFTVEPGLYVPFDDLEAPEEYRGLGVRIEDNILITESGHEVMTTGVPKEIEELEGLVGTA